MGKGFISGVARVSCPGFRSERMGMELTGKECGTLRYITHISQENLFLRGRERSKNEFIMHNKPTWVECHSCHPFPFYILKRKLINAILKSV